MSDRTDLLLEQILVELRDMNARGAKMEELASKGNTNIDGLMGDVLKMIHPNMRPSNKPGDNIE